MTLTMIVELPIDRYPSDDEECGIQEAIAEVLHLHVLPDIDYYEMEEEE